MWKWNVLKSILQTRALTSRNCKNDKNPDNGIQRKGTSGFCDSVTLSARAFSIFRCYGPKLAHEMSPDCFDFLQSL